MRGGGSGFEFANDVADRCKLFHRKFPDRWTNPTALANLYRKHGIKMKKVRMAKSTGK